MSEIAGRSGTPLRRALLWLAAMALLGAGLFMLERMVERKIEDRLLKNIGSIADSYVEHAEASLDFGLPVNGPGSVEQVLQPPPSVASGPDALTLKLVRRSAPAAHLPPGNDGELVVERDILDSHGEASSRLILSRSVEGVRQHAMSRKVWLSVGLGAFGFIFAVFLATSSKPSSRLASWLPAIVFLPAGLAILLSFTLQSLGVARQAAVLAVAETVADLDRARGLGMVFGELVGMQDYLKKQLGSNPAIDQLVVRGVEGITFQAGTESLGAAVTELLSVRPFASFVDLNVDQMLPTGTTVEALVNIRPILADLGELSAAVLVFWVCGAAVLRGLNRGARQMGEPVSLSAAAAPALLFLLLFAPAHLFAASELGIGTRQLLMAGMLATGLILPRTVARAVLVVSGICLVCAPFVDGALTQGAAGLLAGVVLARSAGMVRTLHVGAALIPAVVVLSLQLLDVAEATLAAQTGVLLLAAGAAVVFAASAQEGKRQILDGSRGIGLLGVSFGWMCIGLVQASLLLLVVIGGRQHGETLSVGLSGYVLFAFVLHLIGYRLTGRAGLGRRGRWVLLEFSVLVAVLLAAAIHVGGWNGALGSAVIALLSGVAARCSVDLSFVAPNARVGKAVLTCVRLLAIAVATGLGMVLPVPENAALPAAMASLAGLAPLAYAVIAGLDPAWRLRRKAKVPHAA